MVAKRGWYAMLSYDLLAIFLTNGLAMANVMLLSTEKDDNDDVKDDKKETFFFEEQGSREAFHQTAEDFVRLSVAFLNLI